MNQGNTQMVNTGKTELERSGLDPELLERMDPKERRAAGHYACAAADNGNFYLARGCGSGIHLWHPLYFGSGIWGIYVSLP